MTVENELERAHNYIFSSTFAFGESFFEIFDEGTFRCAVVVVVVFGRNSF